MYPFESLRKPAEETECDEASGGLVLSFRLLQFNSVYETTCKRFAPLSLACVQHVLEERKEPTCTAHQKPRWVGCFLAISRYLVANDARDFFPHMSSRTGMSRMQKEIADTRMCMSLRPMPSIQGESENRTTTERTLRVNTTPTRALPMTC